MTPIEKLDSEWWKIEAHDDDAMARFAEAYVADLIKIARSAIRAAKILRELEAQGDASEDFYHRNCVSTTEIADVARAIEHDMGVYFPTESEAQP